MHGRHSGQLARLLVKVDQLIQLHGAEAVAVGEHEATASNKLGGLAQPPASVGPQPGIDQGHAPVLRVIFAIVNLDGLRVAEIDRQIAMVITVMKKEIDERLSLVSQAKYEIDETVVRIVFHDVPE